MSLEMMMKAMMKRSGEARSVDRDGAKKKMMERQYELLPKLNVLKADGEGLVRFVNFVEVFGRQLKSGQMKVKKHGLELFGLWDRLGDRRNDILTIVHRHRESGLTNKVMAAVVDAHMDDFKDITLFTADDLVALNLLDLMQSSNRHNPLVSRKRMPACKMACYFQVLELINDVYDGKNIFC